MIFLPIGVESMEITRGDIFIADLNPVQGSEQGGVRPVLVIQNDRGNRFSPTVICAAMTSRVGKSDLPTHGLGQRAGQRPEKRLAGALRTDPDAGKAPPARQSRTNRRHGDGAGGRVAAVRAGHHITGKRAD